MDARMGRREACSVPIAVAAVAVVGSFAFVVGACEAVVSVGALWLEVGVGEDMVCDKCV
jgi:hypothetical protein